MTEETFESPLASRYASKEMVHIFTNENRYAIWRKLWIALARAQKNLGLPIRSEQILAMEKKIHDIDFKRVAFYEKQFGHDVMAHIYAFGDVCPESKGIINLGATSPFVSDNTDLLLMRDGLKLVKDKLLDIIRKLSTQAEKYADLECLSYVHYQTSLPTTVGKRICLWLQDLLMDFHDLTDVMDQLTFLGNKGAAGTQSSYLVLFDFDSAKVKKMEKMVAEEMGFSKLLTVSGQTYNRKQDVRLLSVLSSIGVSAHKFGTDLRLLSNMKEMEEPFGVKQIGSAAMPHKRNPNRAERMCGLARLLIALQENASYTAATQWLERTLDDSSNRRVSIPSAFLLVDAVLNLYHYIASDLVVYPKIIQSRLKEELPFLGTENILVAASKKGTAQQDLHEVMRVHVQEVSRKWKMEGIKEDLVERIVKDKSFGLTKEEINEALAPARFIGRAPDQVREFLQMEVNPLLKRYEQIQGYRLEIDI